MPTNPPQAPAVEEFGFAKPARSESAHLTLRDPVEFAGATVVELVLKPKAKAFRGYSVKAGAAGFVFEPYETAAVGLKMAGQPAEVLDLMSPADMFELAQVVLSFIVPGLKTGSTP